MKFVSMINVDNLYKLEEQGLITIRPNKDNTLFIANYTPKVQYDNLWTEEIKQCRGLIFKKNGTIIARPFKKFFNLEEHTIEEIPEEPFTVYDKLDGSLGILYYHRGYPKIATRGAFESDQAIKANIMLQKYPNIFNCNYTYLFEIIYPENKIVVDYGSEERLVLLAVFDTFSGKELHLDNFDYPDKVKKYDGINDLCELKQSQQEDNKEGFVVRFISGMRVKIKFAEYVRLHRIITHVSTKSIWECLKNKQVLDEILERVPDEFYNWVNTIKRDLNYKYMQIQEDAGKRFDNFLESRNSSLPIRKIYASWVKRQPSHLHTILFRMYDNRDYSEIIWKMIRPKYTKPFKEEVQ